MRAQELARDVVDTPQINSWRAAPSAAQIRYATDLCRTELPYAERVHTIASFPALDSRAMSDVIDELKALREKRLKRLRGRARPRRR